MTFEHNNGHNGRVEDLIDFPCSDTFRAYYYERGLTPHPPAGMGTDNRLQALERHIGDLTALLGDIVAQMAGTPVRPPQDDPAPYLAPSKPPAPPRVVRRPVWTDMP